MNRISILLGVLVLLLVICSGLIFFEFTNVLSLQSKINKYDEIIGDRDNLIIQLDYAINLAKSILKLKMPSDSQYLKMLQDQNLNAEITKIFLINTSISCNYRPKYPFQTPWFNDSSQYFSSQRVYELTNDRSILLSFWGWSFRKNGGALGVIGGETPTLNIGVMVRNDYTSNDIGAPIGNRTGNYISSINLCIEFYSENGSIIELPKKIDIAPPTASSDSKMGGVNFLLASGQIRQVIFYLSPSESDFEVIDRFEIYVSSLLAY